MPFLSRFVFRNAGEDFDLSAALVRDVGQDFNARALPEARNSAHREFPNAQDDGVRTEFALNLRQGQVRVFGDERNEFHNNDAGLFKLRNDRGVQNLNPGGDFRVRQNGQIVERAFKKPAEG